MPSSPPEAIGQALLSGAFIAMLITERYVAGRSQNSLVTGLARHGAEVSPATLTGTLARAGRLLAALAEAITDRSRDSWHLHADQTSWHSPPGCACRLGRRHRGGRRRPRQGDGRPGLQEPAKKALATLDRERDGLIAHRDYPMTGLDNYPDAAVMPR